MPPCVICKKPTGCTCKGHWKNIACSIEHYQEFWVKREGVSGKVQYKLRASDGSIVWDIKDYIIKDNNIELYTTLEGKNLNLLETEYLIILNNEKQHLLKSFDDNGEYIQIDKKDYYTKLKLSESDSVKSVLNNAMQDDDVNEIKKTAKRSRFNTTLDDGESV